MSLLSKNQILCKPSSFINENVQYVDFVNKLNYEEFIIFGESTLYLPLILSIQQFDSNTVNSVIENDFIEKLQLHLGKKYQLEDVHKHLFNRFKRRLAL